MFSTCTFTNFSEYIVVILCVYFSYQFLKKISLTILQQFNTLKSYSNSSKNNFIVFKLQPFLFLQVYCNEIQSIIREFALAETSNQFHFQIISIKNQMSKPSLPILRM
jgi:hypothetical protein